MSFDFDELKEILVCPKSRTQLVLHEESLVCVDPDCRLSYEIRDGIPIMLIDEASTPTKEVWSAIMVKSGRDADSGRDASDDGNRPTTFDSSADSTDREAGS